MPTLAPPAAGPARGPWAAGGPEEQRDSDWLHGLCRDEVTVCFHYLYRRSRLVMSRRNFLSKLLSSGEQFVEFESLPFELGTESIKADGEETRQSSYNSIVCESRRQGLFSRQSTQQQEQCAGSLRVKILYPKHTVYQV